MGINRTNPQYSGRISRALELSRSDVKVKHTLVLYSRKGDTRPPKVFTNPFAWGLRCGMVACQYVILVESLFRKREVYRRGLCFEMCPCEVSLISESPARLDLETE